MSEIHDSMKKNNFSFHFIMLAGETSFESLELGRNFSLPTILLGLVSEEQYLPTEPQ